MLTKHSLTGQNKLLILYRVLRKHSFQSFVGYVSRNELMWTCFILVTEMGLGYHQPLRSMIIRMTPPSIVQFSKCEAVIHGWLLDVCLTEVVCY